jgi:hypothetical protein
LKIFNFDTPWAKKEPVVSRVGRKFSQEIKAFVPAHDGYKEDESMKRADMRYIPKPDPIRVINGQVCQEVLVGLVDLI